MGRSCREEKWEGFNTKKEEIDEEALSFCDLPLKEKQFQYEKPKAVKEEDDDEFDFNHLVGNSNSTLPPPMCAADEVFFQGQILPLRLSFGSENSNNNNFSRNLSIRSESMDHNLSKFRNASSSSRSSSSRSQHSYSRSSSISNNSISIPTKSNANTKSNSKPRSSPNLFHSHPSPKPQIRSISNSRQGSIGHNSRSSSRWDIFRFGLVRTPDMELHDLKNRGKSENSKALRPNNEKLSTEMERQKTGILSVVSCKRSVETVPPAPKIAMKSDRNESETHGIKSEKVGIDQLKMMMKQKHIMIEKEKEKEKKENEGDQTLSHRRTFEWLKQLSHASFVDEFLP